MPERYEAERRLRPLAIGRLVQLVAIMRAMTFQPGAKLDPSQVEDMRGSSGGRGTGIAVGGGGIGLVLVIIYVLLGGNPGDLGGAGVPAARRERGHGVDTGRVQDGRRRQCQGGLPDPGLCEQRAGVLAESFADSGRQYKPATTRFFTGQLDTGCGLATADVGPFYCPNDAHVYIDLGFFDDLRTKLGATGGPLAEAYVLAHEYGHHIQDLEGTLQGGPGSQGATGTSVRTELQADCFAGMWVKNAAATGFLEPTTAAQIADALDAASAVGDDRIQQETQGRVTPETWTHGSSAQRRTWFTNGFEGGTEKGCDTFNAQL